MIALFLVGFALMTILSGALSYGITNLELLGIAIVSFLIYKFIIENKRTLFWFTLIFLIIISGGSYYLFRQELLEESIQQITNFLLPFYYSVKVEFYYIGKLHQVIMMFAIGILVYVIISNLYYMKRLRLYTPIIGFVAIIISFLIGTFSGTPDRQAFFLYILTTFIYYYEVYFIRSEDSTSTNKRMSFYLLGTSMAVIVIAIGLVGNAIYYNPFERKVQVVSQDADAFVDESELPDLPEIKELTYELPKDFTVQSDFVHQGIKLFRIKSDVLRYFKVQTFDTYDNGKWIDQQNRYISSQDWPIEPFLRNINEGSTIGEEVFVEEEIEIIYHNVITNSLLVAPFTKNILFEESNFGVNVEEDGAVITDIMLNKEFTYSLQVVIPKYGTKAFAEYLGTLESIEDSQSLDNFSEMPEGYGYIVELSNQITQGLTTDLDKANAIQDYLRTEYQYSERPEYDETEDVIQQFLLEKRVGFCQQFATTMVLMLRAQNIPSRFVVGYVTPIVSEDEDMLPEEIMYRDQIVIDPYKQVYDSNAHAWVEVYVPSFGWIQYEPTPSQNLIQFSDPIDVEFELSAQEQQEQLHYETRKKVVLWIVVTVGIALLLFAIAKCVVYYVGRLNNSYLRFIRTYKNTLKYLETIKLGKEDSQTLREYSDFLDRKQLNSQLKFRDFLAILENAFYNQKEPNKQEVELFENYLSEIRNHVKRNVQGHIYNRLRFYEVVSVVKKRM
jgi:transglutaminase-like putative cysteine protease